MSGIVGKREGGYLSGSVHQLEEVSELSREFKEDSQLTKNHMLAPRPVAANL
jgi:hypothetical protein